MTAGPTELLLLRLALIVILFAFVSLVAFTLRKGLVIAPTTERRRGGENWRLVVISPGDSGLRRGSEFPVAGTMLIGRDRRAGIVIPDASVSTRHASIERTATGWKLLDLGSTNGTLVEGHPVSAKGAALLGNERISVGVVVLQLVSG
jgi:hypothetical protein